MSEIIVRNNLNEKLVRHFEQIGATYFQLDDKRRGGTFMKVARTLAEQEEEIVEDTDITEHPGIGESSQNVCSDFLKSGTSDRLIEVNKELESVKTKEDTLPLVERIGKSLARNNSTEAAPNIITMVMMWKAMNQLDDVKSMYEKVHTAPTKLVELGLEDLLSNMLEDR